MLQKRSTYGDITTAHAETDAHEPQAASPADEQHEKQNSTVEETQLKEDNTPEANTPLPTTPIQCSTQSTNRPHRYAQPLLPNKRQKRKKQTKKKVKLTLKRQS